MLGLGTLAGFVESAKGKDWEDINDLVIPIAILYMIFTFISGLGLIAIGGLGKAITGVTKALVPITTMITGVAMWLFSIPVSGVVGVIELYFGAWLYKFLESIQKSW